MEARSILFPYCIQRVKSGGYILLNRNYKPLGIQSSEWVEYETQPSVAALKITAATAIKLSWDGSDNQDRIYLYNDGCIPTDGAAHMDAYLKRLALLMALKAQP